MKALLVEDDEAVAFVVKTVLVQAGWEVHQEDNAESALEWNEIPDLLITDYNLSGVLNGFILGQRLRKRHQNIAIVLMSGAFEEEQITKDNMVLLAKPFRKQILLDKITQAQNVI